MAWLLTWLVYSLALGAVTAVLVRLPGFRVRAAARAAAWSAALAGTALMAWLPCLTWPDAADASSLGSAVTGDSEAAGPLVLPAVPAVWLIAGALVWAAGVAAWMAWAFREMVRVVALKRASEPWTADERRRLAPWVEPALRARGARLHWCDELDGPALLGFLRPVIALPRVHGEQLTDEELQHVLLHEAAHLRRRDDWASLLELIVAGVLWINPIVHIARRRLGLAREMACDDWVVRQTAAPTAYARCLTAVADLRRLRHRSSLASAATGRPSALARRVARVLEADRLPSARLSRFMSMLTPVAVGALAIVLLQAPPIAVDGPSADASQTAADRAVLPARDHAGAAMSPAPAMPMGAPVRQAAPVRRGAAVIDQEPAPRPSSQVAEARPPAAVPGQGQPADSSEAAVTAPPLSSSPVPGVGVPGVAAADAPAAASIASDRNSPWWHRAASLGSATGQGATEAGRSAASLFKRLGSSVSQSLSR